MSEYLDKDLQPIEMEEWVKRFEDWAYKVVQQDTLPDGTRVSTVWLGLDHSFGHGPPLIFESMAFGSDGKDLDQERYSTQEEAQAGHLAMVAKWSTRQ